MLHCIRDGKRPALRRRKSEPDALDLIVDRGCFGRLPRDAIAQELIKP
jgi:hypothetical protein